MLLLLLVLFIFATMGMLLYAGRLDLHNPAGSSNVRFDTFGWSFLAVFQVCDLFVT